MRKPEILCSGGNSRLWRLVRAFHVADAPKGHPDHGVERERILVETRSMDEVDAMGGERWHVHSDAVAISLARELVRALGK